MEITVGNKLSKSEVIDLFNRFDESSYVPFHKDIDFETYGEKLSRYALFVIAKEKDLQMGFIAYYLNTEDNFVYIPQFVVHTDGRHQGLGHKMLLSLMQSVESFSEIRLEVLLGNEKAWNFYKREGFSLLNEKEKRSLLYKALK